MSERMWTVVPSSPAGSSHDSTFAFATPFPRCSLPFAESFARCAASSRSSITTVPLNVICTGPNFTRTLPFQVRSSTTSVSSAPGMHGAIRSTSWMNAHRRSTGVWTVKLSSISTSESVRPWSKLRPWTPTTAVFPAGASRRSMRTIASSSIRDEEGYGVWRLDDLEEGEPIERFAGRRRGVRASRGAMERAHEGGPSRSRSMAPADQVGRTGLGVVWALSGALSGVLFFEVVRTSTSGTSSRNSSNGLRSPTPPRSRSRSGASPCTSCSGWKVGGRPIELGFPRKASGYRRFSWTSRRERSSTLHRSRTAAGMRGGEAAGASPSGGGAGSRSGSSSSS